MQPEQQTLDLIWGLEAIAQFLNRSVRQVEGALSKGDLPMCRKINGRWCVSRKALERYFSGEAA